MDTRKMLYLSILFAVTSCARPAFADNWWDSFFASNQGTTSVTPSASATAEQVQALNNSQQSLAEDQQRLNEAYNLLRQHQAAGQDTSADIANINNIQQTLRNRSREVRQQSMQVQNPALYQARSNYRTDQENLKAAYEKLRQDQRAGADTTASLEALNAQKQLARQSREQMQANGGFVSPHKGYQNRGAGHRHNGRPGDGRGNWQQNGFRQSR